MVSASIRLRSKCSSAFAETSDVPGNHDLATELGVYYLEAFRGEQGQSAALSGAFVEACERQFSAEGLHIEFSPNADANVWALGTVLSG